MGLGLKDLGFGAQLNLKTYSFGSIKVEERLLERKWTGLGGSGRTGLGIGICRIQQPSDSSQLQRLQLVCVALTKYTFRTYVKKLWNGAALQHAAMPAP